MQLRRTQLYELHKKHAKLTAFSGFEMPLWYKGIIEEHMAVRNSVGIFDISHMGRVIIEGEDAEKFLNYLTSNDVSRLKTLQAQYTTILNEHGGIVDDTIICRLEEDRFLQVPNAANREKDVDWFNRHSGGFQVSIRDVSDEVAMLAVQGPKAVDVLNQVSNVDVSGVRRFSGVWLEIAGARVLATRTGYTGEDGFELYIWDASLSEPKPAYDVWNSLLEAGRRFGIEPCGLGARDTLRLEAGMCLYGNDIDDDTTPLEANLGFVVKLDKGEFIGREALLRQKEEGVKRLRVGIKLLERGIPRPHHEVWSDDKKIGVVTSGTMSPLLRCGIAMAYVDSSYAEYGRKVYVQIRKRRVLGEIVKSPFYDTTKYGYRRA